MVALVRFLSSLLRPRSPGILCRGDLGQTTIRPVAYLFVQTILVQTILVQTTAIWGRQTVKLNIQELAQAGVTKVVIESVDLSLYIAHARIDGEERVIADRQGKVLKTRNLLEMQRMLRKAVTCEFFLRQRSAYDEMVGHAHQAADNSMELPLGREPLPEWLN